MPTGIILQSGSVGATAEAIADAFEKNGYERPDLTTAEDGEEKPASEHAEPDEHQEAEGNVEEAEESAEEKPHTPEHKPTRIQKKIAKATAKLEQQLREANERLAALEGKKTPEPAKLEAKAPKREDFKSDEEFEDAKFDFRYKQRRAKEESEAAQTRLQQQMEQSFTDYQTAVADFKEEHDDWDEVINPKQPIPEAAYYAIVELGAEGPAVTYHLGQHPEEIERLAQLTPHRIAVEIGRLADKLNKGQKVEAKPGAPQKPKPKALPEPVKPLTSSAVASTMTRADAAKAHNYRAFKIADRAGR